MSIITLSDVLHDLSAATRTAADLRSKLYTAERIGDGRSARRLAGQLCMTERRLSTLDKQGLAVSAAIDTLAGKITRLARRGIGSDAPEMLRIERRALELLGCESLDADRWPYAAAALRAREQPEDDMAFVAFIYARRALLISERRAA